MKDNREVIMQSKNQKEAIDRIKQLGTKFNLTADILKNFQAGMVCYSRVLQENGEIVPVSQNKKYEKILAEFERKHDGYLVYHMIESVGCENTIISLLYVSDDEKEWEYERLEEDYIAAYCMNIVAPELSEYGDVFLESSENRVALMRNEFIL